MSPSAKGGHGASEAAIIGGQDSPFGAVFNGHPALVQQQKYALRQRGPAPVFALHNSRNRDHFFSSRGSSRGNEKRLIWFYTPQWGDSVIQQVEGKVNHAETPSLTGQCGP